MPTLLVLALALVLITKFVTETVFGHNGACNRRKHTKHDTLLDFLQKSKMGSNCLVHGVSHPIFKSFCKRNQRTAPRIAIALSISEPVTAVYLPAKDCDTVLGLRNFESCIAESVVLSHLKQCRGIVLMWLGLARRDWRALNNHA